MMSNKHTKHSETSINRKSLLSWAFYDWANSAFATLIQTFIFAAYFIRSVADNPTDGSAQWGYVIGISGFVVALGGPVLGAIADQTGNRKPWLLFFSLLCVIATAMLWFIYPDASYLWKAMLLVGIATVGAEFATIFYNAMLPSLSPADQIGRWSGWAWGLGYAGGLTCLVIALIIFIKPIFNWPSLDQESAAHIRACFVLAAGWYLVFMLPLFLFTHDTPASGMSLFEATRAGLAQIRDSIRNVRQYIYIVRFLIARMIFIDGLATLFAFGGIYAAGTFNMDESGVLMYGIALNVTAGLGAFAFAWLDDRLGARTIIIISLSGLIVSASAILLVKSLTLFWVFGLILGVFVGPVQAASRSYLARVAPVDLRNQMFGLFALSGKATSFLGPLLVGWITLWSDSQRIGMSSILVFLVVGLLLTLSLPREGAVQYHSD